jgi:nicotinic acid mononucleotide adenylyltransferase
LENHYLAQIVGFDPHAMNIFSRDILAKLHAGETGWESAVPAKVADLIKERHLFGYYQPEPAALNPAS